MFGTRAPCTASPLYQDFWTRLDLSADMGAATTKPPVDLFPILKLVPERFAQWKRDSNKLREITLENMDKLLTPVKERLARGEGNGCFMETVFERAEEWNLPSNAIPLVFFFCSSSFPISDLADIHARSWFGSVMVEAGAETTSTFLTNFILLLAVYSDIAKKVQDEMDRVVGNDRLPELDDYKRLPYLQTVVNEVRLLSFSADKPCLHTLQTHRFRPVAPLSVPHAAYEDIQVTAHLLDTFPKP
jgi:hypothetical protein